MKQSIATSAALACAIAISGCAATNQRAAAPSHPQIGANAASAPSEEMPQEQTIVSQADSSECVRLTKKLMRSNDATMQAGCTKRFRNLIVKGTKPTPDNEIPYLDYDFRFDTQGDNPQVIKVGPALGLGDKIHVPVMAQLNGKHFTKTWIFAKENGAWKVEDLWTVYTNGQDPIPGRRFKSLSTELSQM